MLFAVVEEKHQRGLVGCRGGFSDEEEAGTDGALGGRKEHAACV